MDHAIIWTGLPYAAKAGSLRANVLQLISTPGAPVSLRDLLRRAARFDGDRGYNPITVRDAVRLHQSARPAAYILVRRRTSGEYVAVCDVPWLGAHGRGLKAGDVVTGAGCVWVDDLLAPAA